MVHMYSMVLMLSSAYQIAAVKKCIQPNSQMHWIVQMSNFSVSYLTEKKNVARHSHCFTCSKINATQEIGFSFCDSKYACI